MATRLSQRTIETDVLVVGGGLAGCMAAIRLAELGRRCVLAEKGNTRRSGNAATGIDHIWAYVPEIHQPLGYTPQDMVKDQAAHADDFINEDVCMVVVNTIADRLRDLESWGIRLRDEHGRYRALKRVHRVPSELHFPGLNLKPVLSEQVRRRGVETVNRVMVTEVLVEAGRVCGALAVSTREPELIVVRCGAVVVSTGGINRLWRDTSGMMFNISYPPSQTGDGQIMALRAGAELLNMEYMSWNIGPKNFQRSGLGSWYAARALNAHAEPADGKATWDWDPVTNRNMAHLSAAWIRQQLATGKGPVYADATRAPEEAHAYTRWALENEGNVGLLQYLDQTGYDPRGDKLEFELYEPRSGRGHAGIAIDRDCMSTLPGLFAAGDCVGGFHRSISAGALTLGWHAGETAGGYLDQSGPAEPGPQAAGRIEERRAFYEQLLNRDDGATWTEAQLAVQNLMSYYAGHVKSETMLAAGLDRLYRLRREIETEMLAEGPHELMRGLEVLNLCDAAEVVMATARERKETRPLFGHVRADFPGCDNTHKSFLAVKKNADRVVVEPRPIRLVV